MAEEIKLFSEDQLENITTDTVSYTFGENQNDKVQIVILDEFDSEIDAMAFAIFEKYNINDFQGTLFKRKNKPNPIFISEMKNLLKHFIWNWEEYLQKNKLQF